jgi:hypothetical protein
MLITNLLRMVPLVGQLLGAGQTDYVSTGAYRAERPHVIEAQFRLPSGTLTEWTSCRAYASQRERDAALKTLNTRKGKDQFRVALGKPGGLADQCAASSQPTKAGAKPKLRELPTVVVKKPAVRPTERHANLIDRHNAIQRAAA